MKNYYYLSITFALFILISGCTSKRYVNKALKLDEAGLYSDAADMYYRSLVANNNNIDAKLGLQRTGQLVLEDKIKAFKSQYESGTPKDAVYAFRDAEAYYNQLGTVGVKLILNESERAYYKEVEDVYLNKLYQDASKALNVEEFSGAEQLFAEIITIKETYKDSKSKWIIAKYEPIYRRGNAFIASGLYRSAYYEFDVINKGTGGYENSVELKEQALEKARLTIAFAPFTYSARTYQTVGDQVKTQLISSINNIKTPFYAVISDQSIRSIPNWLRYTNPQQAIQMAKSYETQFEAKSILTAHISNYTKYTGKLSKTEKRGYLKNTIEVTNKETNLKEKKVVYNKVRYYEYNQENKVQYSMQYSLVRVDKDEIALSDSFSGEEKDNMHYAQFEGDYKQLVPGNWKFIDKESSEDQVYDNSNSISQMQALFQGKKEISSTSVLENTIIKKCADQIAVSIENYQPEN